MKFHVIKSLVFLFLISTEAFAQDSKTSQGSSNGNGEQTSQANPFSKFNKFVYSRLKTTLVTSAEKMPEEDYNFKPTEAVRSYGQIVGHLADAQYTFCSVALSERLIPDSKSSRPRRLKSILLQRSRMPLPIVTKLMTV